MAHDSFRLGSSLGVAPCAVALTLGLATSWKVAMADEAILITSPAPLDCSQCTGCAPFNAADPSQGCNNTCNAPATGGRDGGCARGDDGKGPSMSISYCRGDSR